MAMKAYEWPKKFVTIMKEAASKATLGALTEALPAWLQLSMLVQVLSLYLPADALVNLLLFSRG